MRDDDSGQYYLHSFLREQPDLNWRNPAVVSAMHEVLRFWLDRGIDGFRVDAIPHVMKDAALRSNPLDPKYKVAPTSPLYNPFCAQQHVYERLQPEVFAVVRGLRQVLDAYDDRVLIGETCVDEWPDYAAFFDSGFHLAFSFEALRARDFATLQSATEAADTALRGHGWPTLVHNNHDILRALDRFGRGANPDLAKALAAVLLCCRGTPFVYYGEELGMPSTPMPPAALCDPVGRFEREHAYRLCSITDFPGLGRDPARTPMPWDATHNGGFSTGKPWLPLGDTATTNFAAERHDPASVWSFYQALIRLRRQEPALALGDYERLATKPALWAFARTRGRERVVIILNTSNRPARAELPGCADGALLLGSHRRTLPSLGDRLQAHEVLVVKAAPAVRSK
jgi:alpha-glucosidase